MKYIELIMETKDELRNDVVEILNNNEIYSFEEDSISIIDELEQNEKTWDFVDDDVFSIGKGNTVIKSYFQEEDKELVEKISKELENLDVKVSTNLTDEEDWANNWKKYYKPLEIGKKVAIVPSWEEYTDKSRVVVEIDPGMAFGTGTHETTYMCIEGIEDYIKDKDIIFDIGCGSGILGITAIKLGADKVVSVDIDENCIEASIENAKLNNVEDKMEIYKGNLLDVISGRADIIVSNIIAEIIVEMIGDLKNHLNEKGYFISSGILVEKIPLVRDALIKEGFEIVETREKGGWALVVGRL